MVALVILLTLLSTDIIDQLLKLIVAVLVVALYIGVLIDIAKNKSWGWLLALICLGPIGAMLYILIQHPKKTKYDLNKQRLGVEEPDKNWVCPECGEVNSNLHFDCNKCGYKVC
jgi:predicted RNA-binding Zn-ribbon protein involved in translation (DUF1610 family)